jgi:hypothetical protein
VLPNLLSSKVKDTTERVSYLKFKSERNRGRAEKRSVVSKKNRPGRGVSNESTRQSKVLLRRILLKDSIVQDINCYCTPLMISKVCSIHMR